MEKQRRLKVVILTTLIIGVLTISVAFSALSRTLKIGGVGKMDTAKWDVRFENLREPEITRDAVQVTEPKIMDDGGVVGDINVKLTKPKDEISYKVDIANNGTIDAEVNVMTIADLSDEEKKLIDFGVYYLGGAKITKYDLLEAGEKRTIIIKIRYKDDITEFDLPSEPLEIKLSCQIDYVQSEAQMVIIPNGNTDLKDIKSLLAGYDYENEMLFNKDYYFYENIENITFLSTLKVPKDVKDTAWDASLNKDGSVVAWYTDLDNNNLYELHIGGNGKVYAPEDCSYLFYNFINLNEISFNDVFDTSNVINMMEMFSYCSLTSLDLSSFDTSKVTDMNNMFANNLYLSNINLSSFDTSNVTDMSAMFGNCPSLSSLDLSSFNTSNVTAMASMFMLCNNLKNLNINNFNTQNVWSISYMFYECSSLTSLDLSHFDTSCVTGMFNTFNNCSNLISLNLSSWNTSSVTDMSSMFSNCELLTSLDLSSFDTSNVTDMRNMFNYCTSITSLDLSSFDTSNVTNMGNMFNYCTSLKSLNLVNANFSSVSTYYAMFQKINKDVKIYVKDEAAKTFILARKSDANVIIGAPIAYNKDGLINNHLLLYIEKTFGIINT